MSGVIGELLVKLNCVIVTYSQTNLIFSFVLIGCIEKNEIWVWIVEFTAKLATKRVVLFITMMSMILIEFITLLKWVKWGAICVPQANENAMFEVTSTTLHLFYSRI